MSALDRRITRSKLNHWGRDSAGLPHCGFSIVRAVMKNLTRNNRKSKADRKFARIAPHEQIPDLRRRPACLPLREKWKVETND